MTTRVYTNPVFGMHETPDGHVEQQDRYAVVERALSADCFSTIEKVNAPLANEDCLTLAHDAAHIANVKNVSPTEELVCLDPDTFMGHHSFEAALRGVGGAIAAVDAVASGQVHNAFVASRPPGHHATPNRQMGFCLFNNVALAALHGRQAHGLDRIAVVDFDVHHGNGTQDIFENDEGAFFASSHEWPQWPGTGAVGEKGAYGQCHNTPIPSGEGSLPFRRAWGDELLPALEAFNPDIILISAGFDAHAADPVGGLNLDEADFTWITKEVLSVAESVCEGRVVSVLEGGYDLAALASSVAVHVSALEGGA
ncbi:MAG: histone deacetylase family protein [Pseudomonadota bacterium]